ncbi:MAG: hypothetical protein K8R23_17715 [Chthoniobacter sp.]|nr:hypothetical protein [Chthoniobacter sp.]
MLLKLAVLYAASHGPVAALQCTTSFPSPSLYDGFYAPLRFIADETSTGDALAAYYCYWTFRPDGGYKYYDASP